MSQRVVVYVTTYCPYCIRAKSLLEKRAIPYDIVDVTVDEPKRAWLVEVTKRRTVPQIFIDGKPIGGSDELHELDKSGKLAEMMAASA